MVALKSSVMNFGGNCRVSRLARLVGPDGPTYNAARGKFVGGEACPRPEVGEGKNSAIPPLLSTTKQIESPKSLHGHSRRF